MPAITPAHVGRARDTMCIEISGHKRRNDCIESPLLCRGTTVAATPQGALR